MSSGREGGGGGGSGPTNRKPKHAARRMSKEKFKPVQTSSNESTGSSDRSTAAGSGPSGPPGGGGGGSASVAALQPVAPDDSSDIIISAAPVPVVKSNANNLNNESGGGGGGGATSGNATTQPMAHSQSKRFNPKSTIKKSNYRVKSCQKSCVSKRPKSKPANGFSRKKSREAMTHASVERCAKSPDTDRSTSEGAFSFDANLDEETKRKFYEHFMATIEFFEKEKNLYMAKSSHKASMISNKIRAGKPNAGERTGSSKPKSKGHTISKEFLSSTAKVASSVKKSKRPKSAQRSFSKSKLVLCPSIDHSAPAPMPSAAVAQPPMTTPQLTPLPPQPLMAQPPSPMAQPQLQVPSNNKMMMMMTTAFHSKQPQIALIAQTPAPAAVAPAATPVPLPPAAGTDPASAMAAAAGGVGGVNAGNPTTIIITNFSNENDALKMFNNFIQNMNMNNQTTANSNGNSNSNNTNNLTNNNLNFNNLNPNNLINNNNPNNNNSSNNSNNNNNIIINSNNPNPNGGFSVPVQRSKNHLIQMAPEPQMVAAPPADNDIITERAKLEELYDELTDLMTNSNTIHHSYEQIVQSLVNLQRRNRTSANKGKVTMLPHSAESSISLGPPNPTGTGTGTGLAPGVDLQDIDRFMNPSTRNEAFKELFAQVDTLKEKMAHFHRCFDDEGNLDENRYAESIRVTYRQSIEWHRDMQELGKIVENILRQYNKDVLELFRLSQCE